MGKGFSGFRRSIYLLAGVSGIYAFYWMFANWLFFWHSMGWFTNVTYIILAIAGTNWLPVAFTNDGDRDLLHFIGLKK